jgi:hypothetical protein
MVKEEHDRRIRKPLFLRLDEELRHQLIDKAREADRSLTGEINNRLRKSLRAADEAAASGTHGSGRRSSYTPR